MCMNDQGPTATLSETWKDADDKQISKVTNAKLGEYLISMSCFIPMPHNYWPDDGCQWSVMVLKHLPSKKHHWAHAYSVVLAASTPAYTGGGTTDVPYVAELSAKQLRNGIE